MTFPRWQFTDEELTILQSKHTKNRLYFALQFKHYEINMAFFQNKEDISIKIVYKVAKRLGLSPQIKPLPKKTQATYCQEIRDYFQSRATSQKDDELIRNWLFDAVFPQETLTLEQLKERVADFLIKQKIESPSDDSLERIIKSARHQHEELLFESIFIGLDNDTKTCLDALLLIEENNMSRFNGTTLSLGML